MKKILLKVVLITFLFINSAHTFPNLSIKITSSPLLADLLIFITTNSIQADESWYNEGRCTSNFNDITIYITKNSILADKIIYYSNNSILSDKTVCFNNY